MRRGYKTKISRHTITIMSASIHSANNQFDFNKLVLTPPTVMSGGNYFIRYVMNGAPLYIQPPKCKTKGGISKSGKRQYTDLLFTNENSDFIQWMEDLEAHTCNAIYENREKWFETEMELSDVENYFASPLKIYKSGKFYLARTNISARLGKISLKIYNEEEEEVEADTIDENTEVVTIVEVQGIKCSARSFQIEIEVKQMMTVSPKELLFEKCLLGNKQKGGENEHDDEEIMANEEEKEEQEENEESLMVHNEEQEEKEESLMANEEEHEEKEEPLMANDEYPEGNDESASLEKEEPDLLDFKSLEEPPILEDFEFDLTLDKVGENETVQLKQRNDVYYEKYREARKKAKIARDLALRAYLEAKQIKQTYLLDDYSDDSDDDAFLGNYVEEDGAKAI